MSQLAFLDANVIEARHLCKTYQRSSQSIAALSDLSFDIETGERVALLGRSGSGKTTLLNLLAGLDRVTAGSLKVDDCELDNSSTLDLDAYRRSTVGVVFQQFRLVKHKSAAHNVGLPLVYSGVAKSIRRKRIDECLELVGLSDRARHRPAELSGGEQQRVAVARAICHRPKLLLADEPTGNLDTTSAKQVMDLLVNVQTTTKTTLLLVTHDERLAHEYADRIIRLQDGKLQSDESIEKQVEGAFSQEHRT